jgi:hypothetical protein
LSGRRCCWRRWNTGRGRFRRRRLMGSAFLDFHSTASGIGLPRCALASDLPQRVHRQPVHMNEALTSCGKRVKCEGRELPKRLGLSHDKRNLQSPKLACHGDWCHTAEPADGVADALPRSAGSRPFPELRQWVLNWFRDWRQKTGSCRGIRVVDQHEAQHDGVWGRRNGMSKSRPGASCVWVSYKSSDRPTNASPAGRRALEAHRRRLVGIIVRKGSRRLAAGVESRTSISRLGCAPMGVRLRERWR